VGGGYLPENNFMLSDLSSEDMDRLAKNRPQLLSLPELLCRFDLNNPPEDIDFNEAIPEFLLQDSNTFKPSNYNNHTVLDGEAYYRIPGHTQVKLKYTVRKKQAEHYINEYRQEIDTTLSTWRKENPSMEKRLIAEIRRGENSTLNEYVTTSDPLVSVITKACHEAEKEGTLIAIEATVDELLEKYYKEEGVTISRFGEDMLGQENFAPAVSVNGFLDLCKTLEPRAYQAHLDSNNLLDCFESLWRLTRSEGQEIYPNIDFPDIGNFECHFCEKTFRASFFSEMNAHLSNPPQKSNLNNDNTIASARKSLYELKKQQSACETGAALGWANTHSKPEF
jgi:hypothetical protein